MKTLTKIIALCGLLTAADVSQAQEKHYAVVNYLQVREGQSVDEYLALENLARRSHQKAVDSGVYQGWFLHRIEGGAGKRFVTVELYKSLDKYARGVPASLHEGLFNPEERETMQQTDQRREVVRTEIWEIATAAAMKARNGNPARLVVQFLKPKNGKAAEYRETEEFVYKKVHQARMDAGQMQSWVLFRRFSPSGAEADFNYVTFSGYADERGGWDEAFAQSVLTKEEWRKVSQPNEARTVVAEETWIPVMHVLRSGI